MRGAADRARAVQEERCKAETDRRKKASAADKAKEKLLARKAEARKDLLDKMEKMRAELEQLDGEGGEGGDGGAGQSTA